MRIRRNDIKEDDAYVHNGEDRVRVVYFIEDDSVHYYAFQLSDGRYLSRGRCTLLSFYNWQNRRVITDEYERLDLDTAEPIIESEIREYIEARGIDPSEIRFLAKLRVKREGNH